MNKAKVLFNETPVRDKTGHPGESVAFLRLEKPVREKLSPLSGVPPSRKVWFFLLFPCGKRRKNQRRKRQWVSPPFLWGFCSFCGGGGCRWVPPCGAFVESVYAPRPYRLGAAACEVVPHRGARATVSGQISGNRACISRRQYVILGMWLYQRPRTNTLGGITSGHKGSIGGLVAAVL